MTRKLDPTLACAKPMPCCNVSSSLMDLLIPVRSELLTLYTTPVIYLAFDRLAQRLRARKTATAGATTENEPP